jgi:DNA polymerase
MRIVCLDMETLFGDDYTLSKLTTEHYIRDPRFEAHGAAIKWGPDHKAKWYDARQLAYVLKQEDWSDAAILCHHAHFDGLILHHHYAVRPRLWLDTLSMARLLLGNHLSVSLDNVRRHYGISQKRTPYEQFKNRHWHELSADTQALIASGCEDEVESIWIVFAKMAKEFPVEELYVIDQTIRMFVDAVLRADTELLGKVWSEENDRKRLRLADLGIAAADLQSNDRFAALLVAAGVEIAYKQGKNGPIPAFAKTDEFMRELLEDDDPYIRSLVEARLGAKSSLLQTRAETLGNMANRGSLCVYLRYCGAHTTRWSGGDASNFQNFRRGSALRKAILAPEGYLLATIDLSQIECRLLNYLAGQHDVIERFRNNEDPYVGIASQFYGRAITKADELERGTGKQAELSCGYGCGGPRFRRVAALGIYGPPVKLTDIDSQRAVDLYRQTHSAVVRYWREAENVLSWLANDQEREWGPMRIKNKRLYAPNGIFINYETLEWYQDDNESGWRFRTRAGWQRIWGSKVCQHVCEMLARLVMSQAMLRIAREGFRPVLSSHDELTFLVSADQWADQTLEWMETEMARTPQWLPGIPLGCEGVISERYAK